MILISCHCYLHTTLLTPLSPIHPPLLSSSSSSSFLKIRESGKSSSPSTTTTTTTTKESSSRRRRVGIVYGILPVDPWSPNIDSQSIASQFFALSLFPYLGFLYFLTKSKNVPKLTLFGFYFLLAFVGATSKQMIETMGEYEELDVSAGSGHESPAIQFVLYVLVVLSVM